MNTFLASFDQLTHKLFYNHEFVTLRIILHNYACKITPYIQKPARA